MPSNIVDVSAFTSPVVVPASGDARTAASVNTAFQSLSNRTKYLYDGLLSGAQLRPGMASAAGANVVVDQFTAVINRVALVSPQTTIPLAGLTPSQWYYVYAEPGVGLYLDATAPDATLTYRAPAGVANSAQLYLGAVRATGAATVRPFRRTRGRETLWRRSALATTQVSSGTPGAFTDVDFAPWAPPHARVVLATLSLSDASSTTNPLGEWRTKGDTTGAGYCYGTKGGATTHRFECETDSAQLIQIRSTSGSGGTTNWIVDAIGFAE